MRMELEERLGERRLHEAMVLVNGAQASESIGLPGPSGRLEQRLPVLVSHRPNDVASRSSQLRFELTAQRDPQTVEHRADLVVERKRHG